jgi:two-component system sensor histidine kinase HydH
MTWSPFHGAGGDYEGSTTIVRDVSSLLEMERRLREQDRLAAVGRLAAQVAHEIKNPLAGIRGACEVMMVRLTEQRGQEIAEEVVRQIDRLNRTVEDLLLFARPVMTRPRPTDMHELIDQVLAVMLEEPNARTLKVVRDYAPQMPLLNVDPEQMQQVMFNVLLNASQAMGYEGAMTVGTRLDDTRATVTVSDSGPGIAEDTIDNIFEPFYTTRAQGTGLGLAIVKKIVQSHRGTVEALASSQGGAEFQIHLPL